VGKVIEAETVLLLPLAMATRIITAVAVAVERPLLVKLGNQPEEVLVAVQLAAQLQALLYFTVAEVAGFCLAVFFPLL
jgi:hypothetical protein